jgi:hypothetical protein
MLTFFGRKRERRCVLAFGGHGTRLLTPPWRGVSGTPCVAIERPLGRRLGQALGKCEDASRRAANYLPCHTARALHTNTPHPPSALPTPDAELLSMAQVSSIAPHSAQPKRKSCTI